jgi:hypothetical protein
VHANKNVGHMEETVDVDFVPSEIGEDGSSLYKSSGNLLTSSLYYFRNSRSMPKFCSKSDSVSCEAVEDARAILSSVCSMMAGLCAITSRKLLKI